MIYWKSQWRKIKWKVWEFFAYHPAGGVVAGIIVMALFITATWFI